MKTLNFAALALIATIWHCWRIMTLRPVFDHLKPSIFSLTVFAGLYLAAGMMRHGPVLGLSSIIGLVILFGVVVLVTPMESPKRGQKLSPTWTAIMAILCVSASVDLAAVVARLGFGVPNDSSGWMVIELAYMAVIAFMYRRHKEQETTEKNT